MHRLATILLYLVLIPLSAGDLSAGDLAAQEATPLARSWQVHSFFDDAELAEKTVTFGAVADDGSLWLAVTDGLYHFDGYRWKRYTIEHGLPSNYVRCVLLTSEGKLWVGTDQGAGVFDGESYDPSGTTGNLAGPSIRRIVEDPDGSLWFCCDQWPLGDLTSGLTRLQNGRYTSWDESDGLPSSYISDYVRDSQGRQFVLTSKGLAQFTGNGFRQPLKEAGLWDGDTYLWSLVESEQHGLIASTDKYFFQFANGQWNRIENTVPDLGQPKLVATRDGEVFTCASGRGPVIYRWTSDGFVPASKPLSKITGGVDVMFEDAEGAVWIAGFERLLRWERLAAEWRLVPGLDQPLMKDRKGGIWFKADEKDLVHLDSGRWTRLAGVSPKILEDRDGRVWMRSPAGLSAWHQEHVEEVTLPSLTQPNLRVVDGAGVVWATAVDAKTSSLVVAGLDGEQRTIQDLSQFPGQQVICRTIADSHSGIWIVLGPNKFPPFRLVKIDQSGVMEVPLPERAQVSDPPKVAVAEDGTLYVFGFFGLMKTNDGGASWSNIALPSRTVGQVIELSGETWVSCRGNLGGRAALMRYRDDIWEPFHDRQGHIVGREGKAKFFVASHGKIQIVSVGVETLVPPIATTPFKTRATSMVADLSGDYWVGVGDRVYRYLPDPFPPETIILGGDRNRSEEEETDLVLRVRGLERFKPTYMMRNFLVSVQIDDNPWSSFKTLTGEVRIQSLPLGDHLVRVRVQDSDGQSDATPALFVHSVLPVPLQSKAWFRPVVAMCFATILGLAVLALLNWTRAHRLARGLKREVALKTSRLISSEREFRLLFEDSQDAICLFSTDGMLQSYNSAAGDLLGSLPHQELSISRIFADSAEEIRFQRELDQQRHLRGARYQILGANREAFDAILSVNMRVDESGRLNGYQVIIRDISTLVELQKRLSENKKMEAVGRMAGGIAHDFNNFLAVVMYGADFVRLKAGEDSGIDRGLQMIEDAAERGRSLTTQIQSFSRVPAARIDVIDTYSVLSGIPTMLEGVIPPNIALVCEIAGCVDNIRADPHQLEQILINLAVNACHAMPDGGKLTVSADNIVIGLERAEDLQLDCAGPYVLLKVCDTGDGMDAATVERIFDPFFTTKPHGQGTGLGLAIVYGIVQQFRGQVRVTSDLGGGTRFDLFLPACQDGSISVAEEPTVSNPASGIETILLVEDEANIRDLVQKSLQRYGYLVHVTEDGSAAQKFIETNHQIDLVVSDIVMPGKTGIELAKWIRAVRPDISCLLISGYADPVSSSVLGDLGIPCIEKPFPPAALASSVRKILDARVMAQGAR